MWKKKQDSPETSPEPEAAEAPQKITIIKNGPYKVVGGIPLVRKSQVVSEYGEPLTWKKDGEIEVDGKSYLLCRCGQSSTMPFCDQTHRSVHFDGTEKADTSSPSRWQIVFPGGKRLIVTKDVGLCMQSGFCNMKDTGIAQLASKASDDTQLRSLAIAMVERCPAGSLTYKIEPGGEDIEPDYPVQIADSFEITSYGPIRGPLWVTGYIEIERADKAPFVARNRVTLCSCGLSHSKPLCDGTHRYEAEWKLRQKAKS